VTRIPALVSLFAVLSAVWPVCQFWRLSRRTALRSTAGWVVAVTGVWWIVSLLATFEAGVGTSGYLAPLRLAACSALLAPIIAVLGARRPGELLWNFIVMSLLVVLSLPILEQSLLGKELGPGRFGLDGPRATLFGIIVGVGVLNYLPTRFVMASLVFGVGTLIELSAMGPWPVGARELAQRHAVAGLAFALCAWTAWLSRARVTIAGVEGQWRRMRDGWGFIWSARLRDRWNAASRERGWNIRLERDGLRPERSDQPIDSKTRDNAERYLSRLLQKFLELE
jgi:hypothetical protein